MNDAELRAAAEEVARALGLMYWSDVAYDAAGNFLIRGGDAWVYATDRMRAEGYAVKREQFPCDLLSDGGAAMLQTTLWKRNIEIHLLPFTIYPGGSVEIQDSKTGRHVHLNADTWPAALVQAAHAALRAGWLEGEGSDAE